jgi:sugar O-acyltransferase (sialic acid O-acetyltransferase NeuD family)
VKLLIAGAGGHGRVVADAALASGSCSEIGFIDDRYPELALDEGWAVVGKLGALGDLAGAYSAFVPAIGDARLRLSLLSRAVALGFECPPIVHPAATVSEYATVGKACVVAAGAIVNIGATLGMACIVNTGATVDHDCTIADGVHICPGAHLAGNVEIGPRTWFGIGAVAKEGIKIGRDVMVGAGAVVVADVLNNATVVGNPARTLGPGAPSGSRSKGSL